jgi:transposase
MEKKQIILTPEERAELKRFCKSGVHNARLVNRARIILALDTSGGKRAEKQEGIAQRLGVSRQTVNNVKNDFQALRDAASFLRRKKRETPPVPPKITGELEARIIALACSKAPKGCARWTLRLLAAKCVELHYSDAISYGTIRTLLKKRNLTLT